MWRPTAATMPGPSRQRLRGCRTPDGEYCRPMWKEVWTQALFPPSYREWEQGLQAESVSFPWGVKEALEAGVPGSTQDLPDRWSGSGTETGRASWEARPPGVNPQWGGSNTDEATVSHFQLRPLSNTLVGAQTPTTGVGEGVALQAQTWEGGWLDPWQFAGHRSKASPGAL